MEIARQRVGLSIEDVALLAELPLATVEQIERHGRFRVADNLRVNATLASYGVNKQKSRFAVSVILVDKLDVPTPGNQGPGAPRVIDAVDAPRLPLRGRWPLFLHEPAGGGLKLVR